MSESAKVSMKISLSFILGVVLASAAFMGILFFSIFPSEQKTQNNALMMSFMDEIQRTVPVVAVKEAGNEGIIGNLTVRLIPGDSNVLIDTSPFSTADIQYSAQAAVDAALTATEIANPGKDFIISYDVKSDEVNGESAGAATTIAIIAALEGKNIKPGVIMTGTINPDGTIGKVGGVYEKAKAVADAGYKLFLIPKGEAKMITYKAVVEGTQVRAGITVINKKYVVSKTFDLRDTALEDWGLEVKEVSTIKEAEKLMIE